MNGFGTLNIRVGSMYSGKSTWLNFELTEFADKGFSVLKIIHSSDNRTDVASNDNSGSTHNSTFKSLSPKIDVIKTETLSNIDIDKYHIIGIDEGQFFNDLYDSVYNWVENKNKHVRVVGLDGDFAKRKFGQILDLIPICNEIIKLPATCATCLEQLKQCNFHGNIMSITGHYTKKLSSSTSQVEIGGSDLYIPVCRYHHSN